MKLLKLYFFNNFLLFFSFIFLLIINQILIAENIAQSEPASHPRLQDPRSDVDLDNVNEYALLDSRSYGSRKLTTPPNYSRPVSEINWFGEPDINWLILGIDYRVRYEYRENDFRRSDISVDTPFLLRSRGFVAIQEIIDPLRFTLEVEDAQRIQSIYPSDDREENRSEPIQVYVELYKKNIPILDNKPISLRTGRMAFELLDRRLVAVNEWRNTTNTFQGSRLLIGDDSKNWNVDLFALQPIKRDQIKLDVPEEKVFFSGGVGTYKFLSKLVTFQGFSFISQQSELSELSAEDSKKIEKIITRSGRRFQTTGLRIHGQISKSGWDYDFSNTEQNGTSDIGKGIELQARATTLDLGYSWNFGLYKPRIGGLYGIATGNKEPGTGVQNRFERLYGFARPWSMNDYITYENTKTAKLVLEFSLTKDTRIDTAINRYWLHSPYDRWERAGLIDQQGKSGTYLGDEWNLRWITKISQHFLINVGYAFFQPGEFTIRQTGRDLNSHFYYIELSTILL